MSALPRALGRDGSPRDGAKKARGRGALVGAAQVLGLAGALSRGLVSKFGSCVHKRVVRGEGQ